jgi:hypothetical protein
VGEMTRERLEDWTTSKKIFLRPGKHSVLREIQYYCFQCCGSGSGSILIFVGWIRIQECKNRPQKIKKSEEISCFEVLDVLFCGLMAHKSINNNNKPKKPSTKSHVQSLPFQAKEIS